MGKLLEVQRFKSGYNPGTGQYKLTYNRVGDKIDPARAASYRPIKRFDGSYAFGGDLETESGQPVYNDPTINSVSSRFSTLKFGVPAFKADPSKLATQISTQPSAPREAGRSLGQGLKSLLPYASNIVNSTRELPNPIAPPVETAISPNLVSYDADRTALDNDFRNFSKETDYKVANPTVAQGIKAGAMARKIAGNNQLAQQEGNTNAFIKNQTAQANQGVQSRNIERTRDFNDQLVSRKINQNRLQSENLANLSDKIQMESRDKSMFDLERRKIATLPIVHKDTGIYDRNLAKTALDEDEVLNGKKRLGGKIKIKQYGRTIR